MTDANFRKQWGLLQDQIVGCERCPRLRSHCQKIAVEKRKAFRDCDYWGRPVPNLGEGGRLLIVGLAPAAHGANRTGRMFTGDRSGDWLFRALHRAGFANQPTGVSRDDGLKLSDCVVTATCHCAPPENRPTSEEIDNCRQWLTETIDLLDPPVFLALGQTGWRAVVDQAKRRGWHRGAIPKFAHGAAIQFQERWLIGSYHPSQQNTFTGRLTEAMFDSVFELAKEKLDGPTGART